MDAQALGVKAGCPFSFLLAMDRGRTSTSGVWQTAPDQVDRNTLFQSNCESMFVNNGMELPEPLKTRGSHVCIPRQRQDLVPCWTTTKRRRVMAPTQASIPQVGRLYSLAVNSSTSGSDRIGRLVLISFGQI